MVHARLSFSAKLPLGVAALMVVVLSATAMAGYIEVRASAMALATERLDHAERQIVDLITAGVPKGMAALTAEANSTETLAVLMTHSAVAENTLLERWKKTRGAATMELWDTNVHPRVIGGPALVPITAGDANALAQEAARAGTAYGAFTIVDQKAIQTEIAAAYSGGRVVGYLVERRPLNTSAQSLALITNLIATNARLLLGNTRGDVWTDFVRVSSGPSASELARTGLISYEREGHQPVFGLSRPLPPTPWSVAVEIPQSTVLAPVQRFVRRAIALVVLLSLAGAGMGWWLSRRFTRPLQRMTDAAVAIAAAHSPAAPLRAGDELQRLAAAFDQMVAAVRESDGALRAANAHLEARVAERTGDLVEVNRELEAFSYSVSHDLRAPLRAIGGFAQILVEDHAPELSAPARQCLDTIRNNATSMGQLIDDLLEFSKLSRQPIRRVPTDIAALARAVIHDVQVAEGDRSIECVIGELPIALAEPTLVTLVVDNLIRNAAKFTRPTAHARIEVGATGSGDRLAYFVRDNGVGFDMRYADKLFGVFQRLHRKDQFEGTGVGLAIVHRAISRHGGRVWADSVVNHGATFFFTLPSPPPAVQGGD
jgi:signal transduction histidine kinase